ncbi:hypothetical protein B0A55_08787 [Friedmanniomyces simplex]|uniref:non-specific serine/threonine protein kinase n=1 Tax=Friedmanniomyces simplex TaxID=329884 RepID=A0A4U0WQJ5_9PEZI|nr:hypothetical protein B0A55_08787 [Friedmanniomyces simplex]
MATPPAFEALKPDVLIKEETLPGYRAERYYPVTFGQVLNDRYEVVAKLGYGTASTVWLCRDLFSPQDTPAFRALKVYVNSMKVHREVPIYSHLNNLSSEHPGPENVRKLHGVFEMEGPHGWHACLVHEACGFDLDELKGFSPDGMYPADMLRHTMREVLNGLQFLHREANVIHTDLRPDNILTRVRHPVIFNRFETNENAAPVPRKILEDRTIYPSCRVPFTIAEYVISDLSEARLVDGSVNNDLIMPPVWRAPEVILCMPWSCPVDVWAFGLMVWYLFQGSRLFRFSEDGLEFSEEYHLAQMVAVLGPPPLDFLERSEHSWKYWNRDGTWRGDVPIPTDLSLESAEKRLKGEDKRLFLAWMRKMFQWKPEDRADCQDMLFDDWLCADLLQSGEMERDGHE